MDYLTFLQSKEFRAADAGFEAKNLNPHLFEYERDVTLWALPAMDCKQRTITWDSANCDVTVEYTPLWL